MTGKTTTATTTTAITTEAETSATVEAIIGGMEEVKDKSSADTWIYLIYAFIVPIIAAFGILTNFINAMVFMRPRMTPSAFTYLAAMSWMHCLSCCLMAFSGFARSIFRTKICWIRYDFQIQTGLSGITTGTSNLILVFVTLDRLIYLTKRLPQGAPRFCTRTVARRIVCGLSAFTTLINIPYFFIFQEQGDGTIKGTNFFHSTYYMIHNWITFILLAVFPAIFLLIANAVMISIIRKWSHCKIFCTGENNGQSTRDQKRYYYQLKLTITIVVVIFLFLIGELPAHLTSRKSVINLLFSGDFDKPDYDSIKILQAIFTVISAIQLSLNIVIYAVINPAYIIEFFDCFHKISEWCHKISGIHLMQKIFDNIKETIFTIIFRVVLKRKQNIKSSCETTNHSQESKTTNVENIAGSFSTITKAPSTSSDTQQNYYIE